MENVTELNIQTNEIRLNVAVGGEGPAVLLLHGFPHTWRVWERMIPALVRSHRIIAPDLRGLGKSERPEFGYDAHTIAIDLIGVLDRLGERTATVIALDAGVPPAFLLGLEYPARTDRLILLEGTVGTLPGAEDFFRAGPPWWFGFHAVPGLAEKVLVGHESEYINFFLRTGVTDATRVTEDLREHFVDAYTGTDALRAAFEHYRTMPANAAQIADATTARRLTIPTMTVGGRTVGKATAQQLAPITNDLTAHLLPDAGHIIPLDAPNDLWELIEPFLR